MQEKILSEGWEWKRLGEIGKIFSGSTPSTSNPEYFDGEIPWITPADLSNFDGIYIARGKKNITEIGLKSSSAQLLPKDTILFSSRAPIGYVAIAANPVTTNQGFKNLVLKEGIDPKYVFYYLKTHKREMQQFGSGSTFLEVSAARFAKIPIIIPPLPVQRQVVAVLEKAEAVKRQRQDADALTGALLQSVFLEMFGDPVSNEKGWEIKQLRDVCNTTSGGTPSRTNPKFFDGGIPWLKSGELESSNITSTEEKISQDGLEKSATKIIPKGTVLIALYGATVGKVGILGIDSAINQAICAIFIKKELTTHYLFHFLIQSRQNLMSKRAGGAQPNISQEIINNLKIPLPPLALQQQFARVVESVERIREQQLASGKEIEGLCEGMIARAFAGELVT